MANTTRSTFRTRIALGIQARTDLTTRIDEAIDDVCEALTHVHPWRELQSRSTSVTTVEDTQEVTLPGDLEELQRVQVNDDLQSYNVAIGSKFEIESVSPLSSEHPSGRPIMCYRESGKLYLVPVPSEAWALVIYFRAKLTLAAAESASISCDGFDRLIVAGARALVFEDLEHGDRSAAHWWRVYNERVQAKWLSQQENGVERCANLRLPGRSTIPYHGERTFGEDGAVTGVAVMWDEP